MKYEPRSSTAVRCTLTLATIPNRVDRLTRYSAGKPHPAFMYTLTGGDAHRGWWYLVELD